MLLPKSSMSLGYQRPDAIKASSYLIAKVVFCSATCAETRKFSVHDKDFRAFCAVVHDSLQYYDDADCSLDGNSIEMFYQDIWSNEWIRFDCPSTWEQAKNMFQSPPHFNPNSSSNNNNNHLSQLQIKVQLINDHSVDIKQHCSLNGRSSSSSPKCNSSITTKRHSRSVPNHFYSPVTPDYQLTVSFSSLEDLIRMSEEQKTVPTTTEKKGDDSKRSTRERKSPSRSEKNGRIKHSRSSSDESKKKKKKTTTTTTLTPIATTSDLAGVTTKTIGTIETMDKSPESQEKRQRKKSSRKSSSRSSSSSSCLISQHSCNFWWGYSNSKQNDDWSGHSNTSSIV